MFQRVKTYEGGEQGGKNAYMLVMVVGLFISEHIAYTQSPLGPIRAACL